MRYNVLLGEDERGEAITTELKALPHMLVTGIAGSGKSIAVNQLMLSLMYVKQPDLLKFIVIDPKVVEFSAFIDNPYMLTNPIIKVDVAYRTLERLKNEMDIRYKLLADTSAQTGESFRNIDDLNMYYIRRGERTKVLPRIVVIIDELSDLMGQYKEVDNILVEIGQKANASGIHLILMTQCPRREVFSPRLKVNIPSRWAFMSGSSIESQIALDETGAEILKPSGDFFFKLGGQRPQHGQASYIPYDKLEELMKIQKARWPREQPASIDDMFNQRTDTLYDALPEVDCFRVFDDLIPFTDELMNKQSIFRRLFRRNKRVSDEKISKDVIQYNRTEQFIGETGNDIVLYLASKGIQASETEIYHNTRIVSFRYIFDIKTKDSFNKLTNDFRKIEAEIKCVLKEPKRNIIVYIDGTSLIVRVYFPEELRGSGASKFPQLLKQIG